MTAVADIHALEANTAGWLVLIEGLNVGFTNISALAGSGASSWIGTTYGARTIKEGLIVPNELPYGETDPWRADFDTAADANFQVLDIDETLVGLFVDDEPDLTTDSMGSRLSPLDDPAPDPAVGLDAEVITLWGRHVGIERIGPAGQRRYFWITPSDAPPGLDHFTAVGWPPARVGDAASVFAGRKVAVYRIVQDPADGSWPNWQDQHDGGSLWWVGTMLDTGQWKDTDRGRAFEFQVATPASWLERTANLSRPTDWYKPYSALELTGDALKVAVWIEPLEWEDIGEGIGYSRTLYTTHTLASGDDLSGCTTVTDYWSQIRDIVDTMVDGTDHGTVAAIDNATWTGPGPAAASLWNDGAAPADKRLCRVAPDGRTIEIKCEAEAAKLGFRLGIAADARVFELAGWDINSLHFMSREAAHGECPVGGVNWGELAGDEILPEYHVIATFSTRNETTFNEVPQWNWDNNGHWKGYVAPYQNGCVTLDHEGGTTVLVAVGTVRCEGQHGTPFTKGSQIDGVDVDTAGWWIFRGQRLTAAQYSAGQREASQYVGVALCEWVATSDGDEVEVNADGMAAIKIVRWEDPRRFGLPFDPLGEPWANVVGVLECAPLGVLGGVAIGGPGWRHRMIVTALLSTGTSTWDTTGDVPTITAGTNQPAGIDADDTAGDIEVADLGLGIPEAFVDWESFYTAASQLPGGEGGALNRVLYPLFGAEKMSSILRECMAGAGWSWSFKRVPSSGVVPAFGCYDPLRLVQPDEVVATLRRTDMAETSVEDAPQWRGTVEMRRGGPYDRFTFEVGGAPIDVDEGGEPFLLTQESTDPGRRLRSGRITWEVKDRGLLDPTPWLGTPSQQFYDWTGHSRTRFAAGIGPRLAKRQYIYRAIYNARFAGLLGLGSPVHVIDATAETPTGVRGVNHRGRVIELSIVTRGPLKCAVRVAIELERKAVDEVLVWGPYAYSGDGGYAAGVFTLDPDILLVGGTHDDTTGFTQPSWSTSAAGDLKITVYQSEDGETYDSNLTATADIVSIDAAANTITVDNVTGTIYRDTVKWLVAQAYDNQTAEWVTDVLAPICAATGLYNGSDKGFRIKP